MIDGRWVIALGVFLIFTSPAGAAAGEGDRVGPTLLAVALLVTSAKIGGLVVDRDRSTPRPQGMRRVPQSRSWAVGALAVAGNATSSVNVSIGRIVRMLFPP